VAVHSFWTIIALFMWYRITWENACLVKYGFPKPFMVYEKGSPEYNDQMSAHDDEDYLLSTLGDLYEHWNFDDFFHF
jgi:hypothetical protein